jgi:choloylglycine hydrolase
MRNFLRTWTIAVGLAIFAFNGNSGQACTGIRITAADGSIVYARTLEFGVPLDSQILFVPRRFEFFGTTASGRPGLTWHSKYATVGLNCFGKEAFVDGVNEVGLAVGGFYFPGYAGYQTATPEDESRALAPWELITWMLTNFGTVDEIRAAIADVRVAAVPLNAEIGIPPVHFIAHDKAGHSLVVEYVDGKLKTYNNPLGVITNSPSFDWHVTNLRNYINLTATNVPPVDLQGIEFSQFGQGSGMRGLPGDFTPPSRFVRAVALGQSAVAGATGAEAVANAFHVLNSFDIPEGAVRPADAGREPLDRTQWTSAADLTARRYYFHTHDNRRIRMVDLNSFDSESSKPTMIPIAVGEDVLQIQPPKDLAALPVRQ